MPRTRLTWRKLLVLVHQLPPESAVKTAIRNEMPAHEWGRRSEDVDPATSNWSTLESLIALLIDEIRINTWVYVSAHTKDRVPKPEPIRRPGLPERPLRRIRLADAAKIDPRLRGLDATEAQEQLDAMTGRTRR